MSILPDVNELGKIYWSVYVERVSQNNEEIIKKMRDANKEINAFIECSILSAIDELALMYPHYKYVYDEDTHTTNITIKPIGILLFHKRVTQSVLHDVLVNKLKVKLDSPAFKITINHDNSYKSLNFTVIPVYLEVKEYKELNREWKEQQKKLERFKNALVLWKKECIEQQKILNVNNYI